MTHVPTLTFDRALAELRDLAKRAESPWVRIERADGTLAEGELGVIEADRLIVVDAARFPIEVPAADVKALSVREVRRNSKGVVAVGLIIGVTAALVQYSALTWTPQGRGSVSNAFMVLIAVAAILGPWALVWTPLRRWLFKWRPIYPPQAGD